MHFGDSHDEALCWLLGTTVLKKGSNHMYEWIWWTSTRKPNPILSLSM